MHFPRLIVFWLFLAVTQVVYCDPVTLGLVQEGKERFFDISVKNESAAEIHLAIDASCDCVKALALPAGVAPGETAVLPFIYLSAVSGRSAVEVKVKDQVSGATVKTVSVTGFVVKKDWVITAEELRPGHHLLIDVRSPADFSKLNIPLSLNLPAFAVKGRKALREKPLVLVDDGLISVELLIELQKLRADGFQQAKVLEGGLAAWLRKNGGLASAGGSVLIAAGVTPSKYEVSKTIYPWHVIQADDLGDVAKIERMVGQVRESDRALNILVVADREEVYAATESRLALQGKTHAIYYLHGGTGAMEQWRKSQAELKTHPAQIVQLTPSSAHPAASGCGTCPAK